MPLYRNVSAYRRVWPTLQRPDGTTLELDPGEEVELPDDIVAAYLELVEPPEPPAKSTRAKAAAAAEAEQES